MVMIMSGGTKNCPPAYRKGSKTDYADGNQWVGPDEGERSHEDEHARCFLGTEYQPREDEEDDRRLDGCNEHTEQEDCCDDLSCAFHQLCARSELRQLSGSESKRMRMWFLQ